MANHLNHSEPVAKECYVLIDKRDNAGEIIKHIKMLQRGDFGRVNGQTSKESTNKSGKIIFLSSKD